MRMLQKSLTAIIGGIAGLGLMASTASAQVFPTGPSTGYNFLPFGVNQTATYQQVYLSSLFGGSPVSISEIAFATNPARQGQQADMDVTIRMGYTARAPGGLSITLSDNPDGPLTQVYTITNLVHTNASPDPNTFDLVFTLDTPFNYNPAQNNLLIQIEVTSRVINGDVSISTNGDGIESSRAWDSTRFAPNADLVAARTKFTMGPGGFTAQLTGTCPGTVRLAWSGAPANKPMGIVFAQNTGSFTINSGPCAGTQLGLGTQQLQLYNTINTGNGSGAVNAQAGPGACGGYVQLVAVDSPCKTSNVVQVP
jgi:hypothetical protein